MKIRPASQKYGRATAATVPLFEADLLAMIQSRGNHPSIVQWTAFNEWDCWQAFTVPGHTVADVVALARAADWQNRPVDTDSGGAANAQPQGDVNDVHSYPYPAHPKPTTHKYAMVGEYGGIGAFIPGKEWVPSRCHAYKAVATPAEEASTYLEMARMLLNRTADISAAIYTQVRRARAAKRVLLRHPLRAHAPGARPRPVETEALAWRSLSPPLAEYRPCRTGPSALCEITDVELECDGFLNYDRSSKFDAPTTRAIAEANRALIASVKSRAHPMPALQAGGAPG